MNALTSPNLSHYEIGAITTVIAELICIAGEVPSGHLYSHVCGHVSLSEYEGIIEWLIRSRMIERRSHLLRWRGVPES